MNPHLELAQFRNRRGKVVGHPNGIIEMRDFFFMVDAIRLLFNTNMLTQHDFIALTNWFRRYLNWLTNSDNGKYISSVLNNHVLYYYIQVASVASLVGDHKVVTNAIDECIKNLKSQISLSGEMPKEVKRTICEHYQMFTLQGWSTMGRIASKIGINSWTITDEISNTNENNMNMTRSGKHTKTIYL